VEIKEGYLYYNETRRRETINFDEKLRARVEELSAKMHLMVDHGIVPVPVEEKHCPRCSLYEICQPSWNTSKGTVGKYIAEQIKHEDDNLE